MTTTVKLKKYIVSIGIFVLLYTNFIIRALLSHSAAN